MGKMKETSKQWNNIKIYENLFPDETKLAAFRNLKTEEIIWKLFGKNVNTEEIIWEPIQFWKTIPNQSELVSHLRRNDSEKWNDVFVWCVKNWHKLIENKSKFKALILAIAENVDVKFTDRDGYSPLMLAVALDDKDSILALIKRAANVNQQHDSGFTLLHFAVSWGNIDSCETLLDNNANIDVVDHSGNTLLMYAAINGEKNVYEFLIEKGADETRINNNGKTASQLVRFQQR